MKYFENKKNVFMMFVMMVLFMMKLDIMVFRKDMKEFVVIRIS